MKKYRNHIIINLFIICFLITLCFIPIRTSKLIPLVEEQIEKDLGVKIHLERLVLRLGPSLKAKTPIVHLMFEDGQKFAQLEGVKIYIPWTSFLKKKPIIKTIKAKKLTVRILSDNEYLLPLMKNLQEKNYDEIPNLKLKEYKISYFNKDNSDRYILEGNNLYLDKNLAYKNFKIKTNGSFSINSLKYITYDLILVPNIEIIKYDLNIKLLEYIEQIKNLDFYSDIIADLKIYKNTNKVIQTSGFINIDNISVLDKTRKNPKSFIYLTLWGEKASILSNIHATANKKVYIEGMINNSKKPILDLKVKTDEININDLFKKIQILFDYSFIKNIKSVDGTLSANFSIKGDLNKVKSNGYMKIIDASINADGLNINKINSDIDFSNNIINIKKAIGYVNEAPIIAKGSINKDLNIELLMNKVELKHLCPSTFGVEKGLISVIAKLNGPLDNINHNENILIEGLKLSNKDLDLSLESLKLDTNKEPIAYINNILCKTKETEQIKVPSLKILLDSNNIKIPATNIFMPNSKLVLKSDILNYNNNLSFNLNLNGFIYSKDLTRFSSLSSKYPLNLSINGNKILQNINLQVLFEKPEFLDEPTVLNLSSKLEKNILKLEDLSLASFDGNLSDDLKLNLRTGKKVIITGQIEDLKEPILKNIRVFIPQIININIFDTLAQIKGDLFFNGKLNNPEIIGQISVQNAVNQFVKLALSNCTLDFNKTNVVVNIPQVKLADTTFSLNSLVSTNITDGFVVKNTNIKSKYFNTDTLLMYKDMPILKQYPVKILDGKFYAEKSYVNIYNSPVYLSALTTDFSLDNNILRLNNITSEIFNGKLSGNLLYNLKDEHFDSKIMARSVSAEPVFNIISNRNEVISGIMDFDANFNGNLSSKQSLLGNVKFVINNGRMSSLGKLEHLLYAQNVIADNMLRTSLSIVTKAITLKDTGLFKFLRGDVDINNGIANIKLLQSQGPLMALHIKGNYNTLNDYAQLIVLGRLSDEVISGLGAFGDFSFNKLMIMLTGEDNKYNIVPEDFEKIPQLSAKNTKEFRSVINGFIDKPSSVVLFNWISYSQKSLKQKEVPMNEVKLPDFIEALPY